MYFTTTKVEINEVLEKMNINLWWPKIVFSLGLGEGFQVDPK